MASTNPDDVRAALAAIEGGESEAIELVETHISLVFLTDQFVYKLKKPVRFDFLDFTTVDQRAQDCRDELRLNSRMAPGVYLDVLPLTRDSDHRLRIGGDGPAVDWLVKMRRLPQDQMLDERIRSGRLDRADVERLAAHLARCYSAAEPLAIPRDQYAAALTRRVVNIGQGLFTAAPEIRPSQARRVISTQLRWIKANQALLAARVDQGHIIEGHGDLRPEHICLIDPPVVFDCVEFNPDLRRLDVVDELAFLAMECDRLGAGHVGQAVLEDYRKTSGDHFSAGIVAFYKSHRACVRAEVAWLRARQRQTEHRAAALREAQADLELADNYLHRAGARPILILVTGLMGTGKSTLARALAGELAIDLLQTDLVRDQISPRTETPHAYDQGRYSPEARRRVYDELGRLAGKSLRQGQSVIVDGVLAAAEAREALVQTGVSAGAQVLVLEAICPPDVARARIDARQQTASDRSQARSEFYDRQRADWEDSPSMAEACRIDTAAPLGRQLDAAYRALPGPLLS